MDLFNLLQPAEDDPYFMRMAAVNQVSQMMNSLMMNPLGGMGALGGGLMGLNTQSMLGPPVSVPAIRHPVHSSPWMDMFSPGLGSSFQSMSVLSGDPSVHSYSSSTMMSMSTGPDGRPMVYQATSSTHSGPGGVCETQKSVCDSITGTKKLQIGRHIGHRGHVIEKEHNLISGDKEEREDFINIEEEEADKFTEEFEWRSRMARGSGGSYSHRPQAITSGQRSEHRPPMLALPSSRTYDNSPSSNSYVDGPPGAEYYTNHYGNVDSPSRNPSRQRRDFSRSSGESHSSRNRNRPRKSLGRSAGDSHPYSCEKIRKRDHCPEETGCPSSSKASKTTHHNYQDVE